jgi:elongation factor P
MMEFLYAEGDSYTCMHPDTFEQAEIPRAILGASKEFLQSGMEVPEAFEAEPICVVLPDVTEMRVATTAPRSHSQQDSAWKEATLENGFAIRVPLFIGPGEVVRVEVKTGRYVERARTEHKRRA